MNTLTSKLQSYQSYDLYKCYIYDAMLWYEQLNKQSCDLVIACFLSGFILLFSGCACCKFLFYRAIPQICNALIKWGCRSNACSVSSLSALLFMLLVIKTIYIFQQREGCKARHLLWVQSKHNATIRAVALVSHFIKNIQVANL